MKHLKLTLILLALALPALASTSLRTNLVNTGTAANSGDGDGLRVAFTKVNTNLYDLDQRVARINVWRYLPLNPTPAQTAVAIQTAIDQTTNSYMANATAGYSNSTNAHSEVIFPEGTYYIDRPLFIRVQGTTLKGMGGWDKVRIYQTADTNIFMPLPWVGWNAGGSEAIWGTIIERMSLETAITTSTNRAGFFWIGSGVQYPLRRMVVRDVSISGFYQGFRAVNGVGLIMQNCDIRRNNYGIHLSKVDNVILQRCTVGEGFGGVEWGTTRSVGILYEGPAPFNLNIFGCEYGGDTHSILAIGGDISVIGGNLEQDNLVDTPDKALMYGPPIMFDGVSSGVIANIRISSVNPQNQLTNPLVYLKGGSGKVTHIVANGWTSNNNAYPHIRLDTAADYVNGETSSLWVTNTATLDGYGLGLRKNAKQFSSQSGATGANDSSWTRTNNAAFTAGLTGTQRGVVVRNTLGGNGPAFLMESATPNNYHSWKVYGDFNHGHVGMTFHEGENIGFYYTNNTGWFCISKNANVGNPIIIAQDGNASSSRTVAIRSQSNPVRNPFEIWNSANVVQAGISETFRWWGNTAFTNLNSVNGHNYTNLPINLTPGNTATPAAWERITNNGVLYYRPLYQ